MNNIFEHLEIITTCKKHGGLVFWKISAQVVLIGGNCTVWHQMCEEVFCPFWIFGDCLSCYFTKSIYCRPRQANISYSNIWEIIFPHVHQHSSGAPYGAGTCTNTTISSDWAKPIVTYRFTNTYHAPNINYWIFLKAHLPRRFFGFMLVDHITWTHYQLQIISWAKMTKIWYIRSVSSIYYLRQYWVSVLMLICVPICCSEPVSGLLQRSVDWATAKANI